MELDLNALPQSLLDHLTGQVFGALTTVRPDGRPHTTLVGPCWDPEERVVRVISRSFAVKAKNLATNAAATVNVHEGGMYVTFEGRAVTSDEPARVARALSDYRDRWGEMHSGEVPDRIAIELHVERAIGMWR